MTPLPKRRWSTRRQGKRRASFVATSHKMVKCQNCGKQKPSHAMCPACGYYKGRQIIPIKVKESKTKK